MKRILLAIAVVTILFACLGQAWGLTLQFSNVGNASIYFPGDSTFTFPDSTMEPSGYDFKITGSDGSNRGTVGLLGNIGGCFTIGKITNYGGGIQVAPIRGHGTFSIKDEQEYNLTATITTFNSVFRAGTGSILNWRGRVNLSNISYFGSNPDLTYLKSGINPTLTISFTFIPAKTLKELKSGAPDSTFYCGSGSVSAIPLPASVLLLGSGLVGLALLGLRRRD